MPALLPLRPALAALVGLLLAACAGVEPDPLAPLPYEAPRVDVLDYDISIDLDHRAGRIEGHVDVTFAALPGRPAAELVLDAVELEIGRVTDDLGAELPFRYDGRRLTVTLAR
ncbi:MAG TPA: hypothetical protein VFD43_13355, partial [Planctomycetota bacterium]|nr:hypothetical protein [Planctomycetota bacterium]